MKIKLIASDIDGTIINSDHLITEETKKAVHRAQEAGIHFMLSTGRAYESAMGIVEQLEIQDTHMGLVCLNGLQTYHLPEHTKNEGRALNYEETKVLQNLGQKYHMGIMYCFDDCIYIEMDERSYQDYAIAMGEELKGYFNFNVKVESIQDLSDIKSKFDHERIQKVAYVQSGDYMGLVIDRMKDDIEGQFDLMRVGEGWTEAGTIGINKGEAILKYAASMDIKPEEIMVFGDSENDVSMFKVAGTAVVMENALGTAKQHATANTLSNDNNGVAKYINDYLDSIK